VTVQRCPVTPQQAAAAVGQHAPGFRPRVGLVLGSGLASVAERISSIAAISYADLPGFPATSIVGHPGQLVLGHWVGVPVACLQGRVHVYEGEAAGAIALMVRSLKLLGCEILLVTNAAGSLRPEVGPGSLMLIADHINLMGFNPLTGPNADAFGPRFPEMEEAYDPGLRQQMQAAAAGAGITLHEGVYVGCLGPSFETPAEVRAVQRLGGDAVGMSTVPEVIVARHCGLRVVGISVLVNLAAGMGGVALSHEQTLVFAARAGSDVEALLAAFLRRLAPAG
jgi:xanthosine phosphorylase